MARNLKTIEEISRFIEKVQGEAKHHAPKVLDVIQPLSDAVVKKLQLGVDKFEVFERNGKLARTCWVVLGGKRYVFKYNYGNKTIDLLNQSLQGTIRFSFDNNTDYADIIQQVKSL